MSKHPSVSYEAQEIGVTDYCVLLQEQRKDRFHAFVT